MMTLVALAQLLLGACLQFATPCPIHPPAEWDAERMARTALEIALDSLPRS